MENLKTARKVTSLSRAVFLIDEDDFIYKVGRKARHVLALKCATDNCDLVAKFHLATELVESACHYHAPDVLQAEKLLFETRLRERAMEESHTTNSLQDMYNEEKIKYPDNFSIRSFDSVKSMLYRLRAKSALPLPSTALEAMDKIHNVEGTFCKAMVSAGREHAVILFAQNELFSKLQSASICLIDGNFTVCPRPFRQFITLHILHCNEVFPVVYILATGICAALYKAIFNDIQQRAPQWQPKQFISEFEESLLSAIASSFPAARKKGCWYQFCQAIFRKVRSEGLVTWYRNSATVKNSIKMIMSLPLLPALHINEAMNIICLKAEEEGVPGRLSKVFSYVRSYWIETIGVEEISSYGSIRHTNNNLEGFNHHLKVKIGADPNFYFFIKKFVQINGEQLLRLRMVEEEQYVQRRRKTFIRQDDIIRQISMKFDQNEDVEMFLMAGQHIVPEMDVEYYAPIDIDTQPEPPVPQAVSPKLEPSPIQTESTPLILLPSEADQLCFPQEDIFSLPPVHRSIGTQTGAALCMLGINAAYDPLSDAENDFVLHPRLSLAGPSSSAVNDSEEPTEEYFEKLIAEDPLSCSSNLLQPTSNLDCIKMEVDEVVAFNSDPTSIKTEITQSLQDPDESNKKDEPPLSCSKDDKLTCIYCPFTSLCKNEMQTHNDIHYEEKPYTCELCVFRAKSKGAIRTHMRRHKNKLNDPPYKCEEKSHTKPSLKATRVSSIGCVKMNYNMIWIFDNIKTEHDAAKFLQKHNIIPSIKLCQKGHYMQMMIEEDTVKWDCLNASCSESSSVRTKTWLDLSSIPLIKVILLIYSWAHEYSDMKGFNTELAVSVEDAEEFYKLLKAVCAEAILKEPFLIGGPNTTVEIEETFYCKNNYNKEESIADEWAYGGACKETKEIFLYAVANRTPETLYSCIKANVRPGTTIVTDLQNAYEDLERVDGYNYSHKIASRSEENGDELEGPQSTWNGLRNWTRINYGAHRHMSHASLFEFMWRKRNKNADLFEKIMVDISKIKT